MDWALIGQIAALITSCLWTFNSVFFTEAGRRIGSLSVNAYRIVIAVGLLCVAHIILLGNLFPAASNEQWFWIGMSGIVGLGIGDFGLFAALVIIGPRRSVLMMALAPIFASIGAFLMLGEIISPQAIIGIAITLVGIIWVMLKREEQLMETPSSKRLKTWGVFLALVGAIGQGIGLVFAKKGIFLEPSMVLNPLSASLIRMIWGALFVWVSALIAGKLPELHKALNNREGIKYTAAGAFIGPFMGVTLSMVAVAYTQAGIAQTLMSLMPVFIIPVVWVLYGKRTSWHGIVGAVIAVIGVAILFLI
ncbi:DMT family transporter [Candidatus Bathyarchaeota archaeon]|nr:MAG: DMT family transporter [Candidatus Bathyarchaeota archaeon]